MTPLDYAIAALAVWRLAALIAYERGPFDVFVRLRTRAGITAGDDGAPAEWDEANMLHGLMVCVWCNSVWLALPVAVLWLVWPGGALWLCLPLALSAGAIAIERWNHHGN
jgi:hypothetical protein